jgi:hypothetical protein
MAPTTSPGPTPMSAPTFMKRRVCSSGVRRLAALGLATVEGAKGLPTVFLGLGERAGRATADTVGGRSGISAVCATGAASRGWGAADFVAVTSTFADGRGAGPALAGTALPARRDFTGTRLGSKFFCGARSSWRNGRSSRRCGRSSRKERWSRGPSSRSRRFSPNCGRS